MPRFYAEVDFTQIPVANFVAEGSPTPPTATPRVGFIWNDTSIAGNAVMKYWDGDEWVRMDGGGDIPNGMIVNRHVADNAAIAISKIDGLQAALDAAASDADFTTINNRVGAVEADLLDARGDFAAADTAINTRIDNLASELTGDYVTLDTDQTVAGVKTFSSSPLVPVADAPGEAVQLSQLTALQTTVTGITDGLDTRLDAVELATQDINNATQAELDALSGRVTAAEGDIDSLQAAQTSAGAALQAEIDRATARENAIEDGYEAADVALGQRVTDEAAARTQGDATNATAITAERDRAVAAEEALDTRVDALEALDPTAEIDAAVAAERDRALAAEGLLDGRLDTLEGVDNLTQAEFNTFNTANTAALALKADLVDGKVPLSQLPSVRTDDVYVVVWDDGDYADADAALASVTGADEGDVAVINGGPGGAFINTGTGWVPLSSGASGATDAEVQAAVAAERALREAADTALDGRLDALEGVDFTQAEADTERTAREAAEAALGTRIDTEHSHHVADRSAAEAALATEVAARQAADTALQTAIDAEADARADADDELSGRITQEVTDRTAADTQIRTDFAAADGVNAAAIAAEVARATAAEGVLTTNLANEANAREQGDAALQTAVDAVEDGLAAEIARATGIEGGHATRIAALEAASGTSGADLTALTNRVTAAEGVNTTQDGRLTALESHDAGEAARIAAAVATEAAAREAADTALGVRVDDEAAARSAADLALGGRIDTEIANRTSADTALGARIDSVESAASAAVAAEATARANADTAIRTDFAAADTAIRNEFAAADSQIRTDFAAADATINAAVALKANDADVVHKTGDETVAGVKTFTSPVGVPTGVADGDAVNLAQLTAATNSGGTALAAEIARATAAEDALRNAATAETTRVNSALALKANLVDGKVPLSELPALALTNVQVVADDAARDALTGLDEGDVVVVTNSGSGAGGGRASFIYDGTTLVPLSSPADVTEAELAAAVAGGLSALRTELIGLIDAAEAGTDALTFGTGGVRDGNAFNVVGTADRIVANADSIDIAATYVGQASITTLGTITTGTWNGTAVGLQYGGTGYAAEDLDDLVDHLGIVVDAPLLFAQTLTGLTAGVEFSVNHGMNATDVIPSLRTVVGGEIVFADIRVIDADHVGVTVDPSYDVSGALRITIVGGAVDATTGRIMGRTAGRSPGRFWAGRAWS